MKQIFLLFSLAFCLVLLSCESKGDIPETVEEAVTDSTSSKPTSISAPIQIKLTASETTMTKGNMEFAMKFFSTIYNSNKDTANIIVSPFSMSMAIAVLRNGAEGETKRAIKETMCMTDFDDSEINACFRKLRDGLTATDSTLTLALANSVWYDKNSFTANNDFVNLSKTWFDALVTGLDYNSPNALATVNKWCEDNTNGLIKNMLDNLFPVEILNALYFKGDWSYGYEFEKAKTTKQPFTKSDGAKTNVDLMHNKTDLGYYEDGYLSFVTIPYGNQAYNIYFVLPAGNSTFENMLTQLLVPDYWSQHAKYYGTFPVDVYIPKFELRYENKELKDILVRMGMGAACSGEAQFPYIAVGANFFVGRATQKTYFRIDEEGTEAAAVSELGLETADIFPQPQSAVKTFRADRPFLFVIQENSTGTILFMGKVGDPTKK